MPLSESKIRSRSLDITVTLSFWYFRQRLSNAVRRQRDWQIASVSFSRKLDPKVLVPGDVTCFTMYEMHMKMPPPPPSPGSIRGVRVRLRCARTRVCVCVCVCARTPSHNISVRINTCKIKHINAQTYTYTGNHTQNYKYYLLSAVPSQ